MRLFLDFFYEIKENKKRKYDKLEMEYQERSKKLLDYSNMATSISTVIISACIMSNKSESEMEKTFTWISIICSLVSFFLLLCNSVIGRQKEFVKRKIENYTKQINRIEEVTGKLAKTEVEIYDSERDRIISEQLVQHAGDISQLKNRFNKLMHPASLESRDKLNISPQKMSRRGSTVLAERRSSSFLGNLGEKLDHYVRRTSRIQDTMEKLDNESCFITINEHSESKPKAPKNKLKNVATKLKIGNIFSKKKEDLIASSSLSEGANQENIKKMNEENCGLIKRFGDTNGYSIFATPFNPSDSTSREECGNNHSAARHVSYGSANNSVSEEGANKFPSATLSSPGAEIAVKEIDFLGLEYRPRVYSSPPCMSKREITDRVLEYVILSDHIERGK